MLLEHGSQFTYASIKILEFEPCFWFKVPGIVPVMKFINLKKAFFLAKKLARIACKYEKIIRRESGAKGEIGEIFVSKKMGLRVMKSRINPGFDAIDKNSKKVQIKVISAERLEQSHGRISRFPKHPFDYLILGVLDTNKDFRVIHAYKSSYSKLNKMISKYPRRNPPISQILNPKVSKRLF